MSCILGIDKQGWILIILWVVRVSHCVVLFLLVGDYTRYKTLSPLFIPSACCMCGGERDCTSAKVLPKVRPDPWPLPLAGDLA